MADPLCIAGLANSRLGYGESVIDVGIRGRFIIRRPVSGTRGRRRNGPRIKYLLGR